MRVGSGAGVEGARVGWEGVRSGWTGEREPFVVIFSACRVLLILFLPSRSDSGAPAIVPLLTERYVLFHRFW